MLNDIRDLPFIVNFRVDHSLHDLSDHIASAFPVRVGPVLLGIGK